MRRNAISTLGLILIWVVSIAVYVLIKYRVEGMTPNDKSDDWIWDVLEQAFLAFFAAYPFYVFTELLARRKAKREAMTIQGTLMDRIVDEWNRYVHRFRNPTAGFKDAVPNYIGTRTSKEIQDDVEWSINRAMGLVMKPTRQQMEEHIIEGVDFLYEQVKAHQITFAPYRSQFSVEFNSALDELVYMFKLMLQLADTDKFQYYVLAIPSFRTQLVDVLNLHYKEVGSKLRFKDPDFPARAKYIS